MSVRLVPGSPDSALSIHNYRINKLKWTLSNPPAGAGLRWWPGLAPAVSLGHHFVVPDLRYENGRIYRPDTGLPWAGADLLNSQNISSFPSFKNNKRFYDVKLIRYFSNSWHGNIFYGLIYCVKLRCWNIFILRKKSKICLSFRKYNTRSLSFPWVQTKIYSHL